jgi:hypothetical protein
MAPETKGQADGGLPAADGSSPAAKPEARPEAKPEADPGAKPMAKPAAQALVPSFNADSLNWSGPMQQGCIEADPFVMWVAVTFVTIITILYFFLRGVKRPTSRDKG